VIPFGAMLAPILIALFLPDYSSISQHISEVALLDHPVAIVQRAAAIAAGTSILLFGVGLILLSAGNFRFTAIATTVFAASMISNGVVVMGSPLHGLYGLGLFMVLVPAFFASEIPHAWPDWARYRNVAMAVALFNLTYMWLLFSGLEPQQFRGLTQRVATVVIFGWYTLAGNSVLQNLVLHSTEALIPPSSSLGSSRRSAG
jgi:hypothetical protein